MTLMSNAGWRTRLEITFDLGDWQGVKAVKE